MILGFHGGGEPSMNWQVLTRSREYAAERAARAGIRLDVCGSFNGCWSPEVSRYVTDHFTEISLSFDGLPAVQDAQRPARGGRGSYDAVARTLCDLDAAGFRYGLRMTVTRDSVGRLCDGVRFILDRFRPAKIQVEPVFDQGRARENRLCIQDPSEFIQAFIAAHRASRDRGIDLFYSGADPGLLSRRFCTAACRALVVTPEGDVTTCFEIHDRSHPLKDHFIIGAFGAGRFDLDGQKRAAIIRRCAERTPTCRTCFCRWHCAGDCAPRALAHSDADATGRCRINQELTVYLILEKIRQSGGFIYQESHGVQGSAI